jgi:hypothetical protein
VGYSGQHFAERLAGWMQGDPCGLIEIVTHPGMPMNYCGEYEVDPQFTSYLDDMRCHEMQALMNLHLKTSPARAWRSKAGKSLNPFMIERCEYAADRAV